MTAYKQIMPRLTKALTSMQKNTIKSTLSLNNVSHCNKQKINKNRETVDRAERNVIRLDHFSVSISIYFVQKCNNTDNSDDT